MVSRLHDLTHAVHAMGTAWQILSKDVVFMMQTIVQLIKQILPD